MSDVKKKKPVSLVLKRAFDIFASLFLLIPVGVVLLFSSFAILIEDGRPIFYVAQRIGRGGKLFNMLKLRSMRVNAPDIRMSDGSTYNGDDDPRVTKFGKFARRTSIDELPQIFNILKGDMSFVGPRPDTPMYLEHYTDEERIILTMRPGITGYNQAVNRNSVLTKEKLKNDIYYVENFSIWLDIKIVFLTVANVFSQKNIHRKDSNIDNTYILENSDTGEEKQTV